MTLASNLKKPFREFATGYNLALKFGVMTTLPIICALISGILLDKQVGTTPWFTLIFVFAGLIFSVYAMYRVAMRDANQQKSHKEERK